MTFSSPVNFGGLTLPVGDSEWLRAEFVMTSVLCNKFRTPRMSKGDSVFTFREETSCHGEPQKKERLPFEWNFR